MQNIARYRYPQAFFGFRQTHTYARPPDLNLIQGVFT